MALSTRHPPSLRRVPASPVPRLQRYYEGATTSRIRVPGRLCFRCRAPCRPLVCFVSRRGAPGGPEGARQAREFGQPVSQPRCLRRHGRIRDLIGSQAIRSVPLPRLPTPAGSVRPRLGGRPDTAPAHRATKAPAYDDFVAIIPRLQYPLPTLHECRCLTHARLASGWLACLCREGVQPSGSLPKVSTSTSASPFPELPIATFLHLRETLSCPSEPARNVDRCRAQSHSSRHDRRKINPLASPCKGASSHFSHSRGRWLGP